MKQQANVKERYIQLVETFITAIESGRTGAELQEIRNEIKSLSARLNEAPPVENRTHIYDFLSTDRNMKSNTEPDNTIS